MLLQWLCHPLWCNLPGPQVLLVVAAVVVVVVVVVVAVPLLLACRP